MAQPTTPLGEYDAGARTTRGLLRDWAAIMRALRDREVIRTNNNPTGDIAEVIVARHYGGERGSFTQAGWDVLTRDGERLQVKALRRTDTGRSGKLSPIRDSDYDAVVVVVFGEDFDVDLGVRLSRTLVEELFPHKPYVNGRSISITRKLLEHPQVELVDLSDAVLDAYGPDAPGSE